MAVLVEAISVIVRRDSIEKHFIGGWPAFLRTIPNATLCHEDELACVGFMDPDSARHWVDGLEDSGLVFIEDDKAVDIVICDQISGPTTACEWIEFGKLPIDKDKKVNAAWLYEGPRIAGGFHLKSLRFGLAVPARWTYERSFSNCQQSVMRVDSQNDLEYLREEDGVEVYWNKNTLKEVYIGRTGGGGPLAPKKRLS